MTRFDELVSTATRRLRVDREVQLDVQHELQMHLEDAAEEYREGGYSEENAEHEAAGRFGDAEALAESIWEANRRRLRWRSMAWWAIRLTLVPLLTLAVLAVPLWQWMNRIDPAAVQQRVELWIEAEPATRAAQSLAEGSPAEDVNDLLAQAAKQQPGSMTWRLLGAASLYQRAATYDDESETLSVSNRQQLAAARRAIDEAAEGSVFVESAVQMAETALNAMPRPRTSASLMLQRSATTAVAVDRQMPLLGQMRVVSRYAAADAIALAQDGDAVQARALARDLRTIAQTVVRDSDTLISLLVGVSMYAHALEASQTIESTLGDAAAAAAYREQAVALEEEHDDATRQMQAATSGALSMFTAGPLSSALSLAGQDLGTNASAIEAADHALARQLGVTTLLVIYGFTAGLLSLMVGIRLRRTKQAEHRPVALLPTPATLGIAACVGAAAGTTAVLREPQFSAGWMLSQVPTAMALLIAVVVLAAWQIRRRRVDVAAVFSTLYTALPLIGIAGVFAAAVAVPLLAWSESAAVAAVQDRDAMTLVDEVDRSPYRDFRDWIVQPERASPPGG